MEKADYRMEQDDYKMEQVNLRLQGQTKKGPKVVLCPTSGTKQRKLLFGKRDSDISPNQGLEKDKNRTCALRLDCNDDAQSHMRNRICSPLQLWVIILGESLLCRRKPLRVIFLFACRFHAWHVINVFWHILLPCGYFQAICMRMKAIRKSYGMQTVLCSKSE